MQVRPVATSGFGSKRNKCFAKKKYLITEMDKIQIYTNDNLEFRQYYRCNTTNMDDHFFLCCNADFRIYLSNIHYLIDKQFCTSHDHTAAFIQAYDKLSIYLNKELGKLYTKFRESEILEMEENIINSKLFWSESKIALIELIYAIYSTGAVNHGVTDIKVLKEVFEKIFHIELGDLYHSFAEMRMRKKDRTIGKTSLILN
ncbi:MAG TPA: RteC domain-containing protein [Prolixibacteraceae bacterium]|nr:RteC domain-containing protein [Prolixibacteraceae bacterium]